MWQHQQILCGDFPCFTCCPFYCVSQDGYRVSFMTELRFLFALMLGSKRKYVDPTKAVQVCVFTWTLKHKNKQMGVSNQLGAFLKPVEKITEILIFFFFFDEISSFNWLSLAVTCTGSMTSTYSLIGSKQFFPNAGFFSITWSCLRMLS